MRLCRSPRKTLPRLASVNAEPDEHDAIAWFTEDALGDSSLAHDSYLAMFSRVHAEHRA